jgi:fatty acid desaturase
MSTLSLVRSSADQEVTLDRDVLRALSRPAPWRLLLQTALEWGAILLLAWCATATAHPVVSLLCILLIATRQHALLALMHEYSHYQLSRRRPAINDLVGDVFTAFPFFITVFGFRRNHQAHHRFTSSADDPNWMSSLQKRRYNFPMTRASYLYEVAKHCIGFYTVAELKSYTVDSGMALALPRSVRIARAGYLLVVVTAVSLLGWWREVLLYWLLPMSTFLMAILYVRDVGEHFGIPGPGSGMSIANSRTVIAGWLERLLVSQNQVHFHTEHHLFPGVPFFRLPRLHAELMKDAQYRVRAVLTRGYFGELLEEISSGPARSVHSGKDVAICWRTRTETRYLQPYDVPRLMQLEHAKWEPDQAAEAGELLKRIHAFPTLCIGTFCLDSGKAMASLFMRPVAPAIFSAPTRWDVAADPAALQPWEEAGTRSLFGISLSSRRAEAVDAIFGFFYGRALKAGWQEIFLGSPIPGFAKARGKDDKLSVWRYVHARRLHHLDEPLDPQLRYYFRKGFRQIVSIHPDYFPHPASLDYGVILRGRVPLARLHWLWRRLPEPLLYRMAGWMMRVAT